MRILWTVLLEERREIHMQPDRPRVERRQRRIRVNAAAVLRQSGVALRVDGQLVIVRVLQSCDERRRTAGVAVAIHSRGVDLFVGRVRVRTRRWPGLTTHTAERGRLARQTSTFPPCLAYGL